MLILRSSHVGWTGLRVALEDMSPFQVIAEATDAEEAVRASGQLGPDLVVAPSDAQFKATPYLIEEFHAVNPRSKIIVIGTDLNDEDVFALYGAGTDAYLLWSTLDPTAIESCPAAVIDAGLRVGSQQVFDELARSKIRRDGQNGNGIVLTKLEATILRGLAVGCSEKQVAKREHLSVRTVESVAHGLRGKLGAPTLFVLGMRAAEAGIEA